MFAAPGTLYVYRSYGIHWCVNVVCEPEGAAAAVLLRALEPTRGIAEMRERRATTDERLLCSGPGRLTQALEITGEDDGRLVVAPPFALRPPPGFRGGRRRRGSASRRQPTFRGATWSRGRAGRRAAHDQRDLQPATCRDTRFRRLLEHRSGRPFLVGDRCPGPERAESRARRSHARADEIRKQPVAGIGSRDVQPHAVVRREEAVPRLLLDDVAGPLARLWRGPRSDSLPSGCRRASRSRRRRVLPITSGTVTSFA